MCSGRISSSSSISDSRRVTLVTISWISHELGKDGIEITTNGTYPWSFVTQLFRNNSPSHDGDRKIFEVMA
jgi:hypothetical protein